MNYIILITTFLVYLFQSVLPSNLIIQKIIDLNKAPDLRPLKKSLGYSEDTYLNFTELTTKYKFPSEEHTIMTEDGYILTIFRILSTCGVSKGYPVVLMHGIIDSSDAWILTGPNKGLGFILANNCYDVWTGNHRGNFYSRRHVRLDPDRDPQFWDFSFEEIGLYDVPAIIDYVLMVTKKDKVIYIGHSQGTTDFFVTGSLKPDYNNKVHLAIALAPIAGMANIRSPLLILATKSLDELVKILKSAGIYELAGRRQYIPHEVTELLCQIEPLKVCGTIFFISVGAQYGSIEPRTLSVVYGHIPDGVSVKTLNHFGQLIKSKKFQRFDEGKRGNLNKYGSNDPPIYNLSLVTSPTILIGAKNDWLSDLKDVEILGSQLSNLVETYIVPVPYWSHNDHIWGVKATEYVFKKILSYLQTYNSENNIK